MTELVKYEAAKHALAAVHTYDEVKDIMDEAERRALYARQANDTELMEWATEIRVRAQRRVGEMLSQTAKATGAKGVGPIAVPARNRNQPTLAEIGITKKQSANWQALASMSPEHFETTVGAAKEAAGEVTTAFMVREAKAEQQRAAKAPSAKSLYRAVQETQPAKLAKQSEAEKLKARVAALEDELAEAGDAAEEACGIARSLTAIAEGDEAKRLIALEAENKTLRAMRDHLMNENAELKRQCKFLQRRLDAVEQRAA